MNLNARANPRFMLLQKVERQYGVTPDVIICEEAHHLFLRHRLDFGSAIGRIVQLRYAWHVEHMFQDDWLEPFKVFCALISVEMGSACPSWSEDCHFVLLRAPSNFTILCLGTIFS